VVLTATLSRVPGTPLRQLLVDGRSVALRWIRLTGPLGPHPAGERWKRKWWTSGPGTSAALTGGGEGARGPGVLRAPMPGLVVRVLVQAGQVGGAGAGLVVLEAMKMENELKAAAAGTVRGVRVRPGEAVEKGR